MERVIVALSGGVDSAYTAYTLRQQGYEVRGLCLELFEGSTAAADALLVGEKLGIQVDIIKSHELFQQQVVDYFCGTYAKGQTPNPCVACNPGVKFAVLMKAAAAQGADKVATGHYIRCLYDEAATQYQLWRAKDPKKDQSYFLYRLSQDVLSKVIFPLGGYTKEEVRALASQAGIPVAQKRDSQEICFVPDGDYQCFLRRQAEQINQGNQGIQAGQVSQSGPANSRQLGEAEAGLTPGDFVDQTGKVLGRHQGLACYTIGQRKNLGIALGRPVFVLELDPVKNQVVLGSEEDLYTKEVFTADNTFLSGILPPEPLEVQAKLRSGALLSSAIYYPAVSGRARLVFAEAQRAVTPGQSAVYYSGDQVLGGGIILSGKQE